MPIPILLVCSVALELDPLLELVTRREAMSAGRCHGWSGTIGNQPIVALAGGMGKVNAAHSLTAILEHGAYGAIIGFGVAGAYPGSTLEVGATAVASSEVYGDEGVLTPNGWISCEGIGIPLVEGPAGRFFNHFPSDPTLARHAMSALESAGAGARLGAFVTVSSCSGTLARGAELAHRFEAICESMEGAAYAHTSALYGVPYLEIRGISNLVEDRDMSRWNLAAAAQAAARAVAAVVPYLHDESSPDRSRARERV